MNQYHFDLIVRSDYKIYERIKWSLPINLLTTPSIQSVLDIFPDIKIVLRCVLERINDIDAKLYFKYSLNSQVLFLDCVSLLSLFN
jgi:hypothetical protein